jgi:hypothetical protein
MSGRLAELTQSLRAQGLIAADAAVPPEAEPDTPWFLALMQGIAGWLAGVFLLAFIAIVFKPDDRASILLVGALLLVAAWLIYRAGRVAVFLEQFALALSIAGQLAITWGIVDEDFDGLVLAFSLLVLQVLIWLVMPNRTARTLAALFATIAWVYTIRFLLRSGDSIEDFLGFGRNRDVPIAAAWTLPVGWLLTWLPMVAAVSWLIAREPRWIARGFADHARPALTGLVLGLALAGVAAEPFIFLTFGDESMGMKLSWWALFPLLSIALAGFAAYGAFRLRSIGLLGFAVLAAMLHLSRFYYFYGTTLLWKSLIMLLAGTGMLMLGVWMKGSDRREGVQ